MEKQTQARQTQALDGHQTRGKTGEQGVRALRPSQKGLVFFKPGNSPIF
jgi:hypothetical protein